MPDPLAPGVHLEEIGSGPPPIAGMPTGTAAFIGETERGSLQPRLVTGYRDYQRGFGETFSNDRYLPHAVRGFFDNGGQRLFVCRIVGRGAVTARRVFGDCTVRAAGPGAWGNRVWVKLTSSSTAVAGVERPTGFRLQAAWWPTVPPGFSPFDPFVDAVSVPRPEIQEDFDGLQFDLHAPEFGETRLKESSVLVRIELGVGATGTATATVPTVGEGWLDNGVDAAQPLDADDYVGAPVGDRVRAQGLAALDQDACRDVALVYAPTPPTQRIEVARAVIAHCEASRFRFAVIDGEPGVSDLADPALDPRSSIADSAYAAFYHPWLEVSDPQGGARVRVPPGGHVLGVYARTDSERGVFKAPANEVVRGVVELEFNVNETQQAVLNPRGVNVTRSFPGRGIRVWGARTLSSDPLWKYVNVRRLFIFLERSIGEGTQWVVFEPNDERLWARVKDSIRVFLRAQWRNGALPGRTEDEAFFMHCDRTTMTQDDLQNGRLICEIGVAVVRPAEFVIFRLLQRTAET
jgi:hypothetical protein